MAVEFIAAIHRYQGLAADDKPTTNVPAGATFHVLDTGEELIFHNGGWVQDLRLIAALRAV